MRIIFLILIIAVGVGVPVYCGLSLIEGIIIFILAVLWLDFLSWVLQRGSRPPFTRYLFFWWVSAILDKPEWLYPD